MGNKILNVQNLGYSFGPSRVLSDISFTLDEHDFVSFIGPSGCGKTTLLHIITGIHRGYTGLLEVRTDHVSFVFQRESLLEWRDALSNVLLPFELRGDVIDEAVTRKAADILEVVGLGGFEHYFPGELSGGMRKRVEIARALVTEPDLLILDEPFSALDIITREKLNILVKQIHGMKKTSVVLVTHSVEEACFLSNRVFVMSRLPGRIIKTSEIASKESSCFDRFQLTDSELAMNMEIRESAKFLWTEDAPSCPVRIPVTVPETGNREPGSAAGTHKDSRSAAAPRQKNVSRHAAALRPAASDGSPGIVRGTPGRRTAEPGAALPAVVRRHRNVFLIPLELTALFFLLTWLKGALEIPDLILPYPGAVLGRFFATLASGDIFPDLWMTILESLSGFFIAFTVTLVLGYIIAKSRLLSDLFMPYLVAANTIPSVALAPFLVLWFGFGLTPRIVTSVIVIFFPMLINTTSAIRLATQNMKDLLLFYRPTWRQSFLKFEFPAALPVIWSGIKISITLSVIGAVVGEFVSGNQGLGALVSRSKAIFDVEMMFVGMLWLIVLGLGYYGSASLVYQLILKRRRKSAEPPV